MVSKTNYFFACDHALLDNEGKTSAIGIFNKVPFTEEERNVINFFLVGNFSILDADPSIRTVRVEVLNSNNEIVGRPTILNGDPATNEVPINVIVRFPGFEIPAAGTYRARLFFGDHELITETMFSTE